MNRRHFIKTSSLAGISLSFFAVGCTGQKTPREAVHDLDEVTVGTLREKMRSGELTSRAIVEIYLERIESIDKNGPALNSVIEINPDALVIADTLDQELKSGKVRGPLHGIPVLIKDNINTGDKMMTTAGSMALTGHYATRDAFIVSRLRAAGAVILGKTNLSEWANFRSTRSSSGWSSRGGQTKNPYVLDRNPCGSSSGSGTAVSANLCVLAIGTETNGSIACPSSINGVVGIKPTVGLWSRAGIIPISHTQDTAGPMTRTVTDGAILLGALAGMDPEDKITASGEGKGRNDYTQFLDVNALKGKKIGVEKSYLKGHEAIDALLQKAIGQMRAAGAAIIEVDFLSRIKIEGAEFKLLKYEFKDGLNRYLASSKATVRSLKEVIEFNKANEPKAMPFFKQEILEASEELDGLDSKEYKEVLAKILSVRKIIDDTLQEEKLDAICGPANGASWCTDLVNGDSFTGYGMYSPAAMAGYPHITVPMGLVFGLPVGLTFFASAYQEPAILAIAFAYEQLSRNRVKPEFRNSVLF